jgi:hypothetical protein
MKKKRNSPSNSLSESVLREFRHRCAVCGRHSPQLHHIDEDPSNTVAENLLPLCPNCHLQDLHDPTSSPDPLKIRLFRRTKDPFILDPRFDPIWKRLRFLTPRKNEVDESWDYNCKNLLDFIGCLKMGEYYRPRILSLLCHTTEHFEFYRMRAGLPFKKADFDSIELFENAWHNFRANAIEDLCVEMLRYQEWSPINRTEAL